MAEPEKRVIRARATEVYGSNAGAGSGTLALYRKHRRVELDRVEKLDLAQQQEESNLAVRAEVEARNQELDSRTEKNRKRRLRRKPEKPVTT